MAFRQITMRQLVARADPNWERDSKIMPEYEFNGDVLRRGDDRGTFRTYKDGKITFFGRYSERGPYGD